MVNAREPDDLLPDNRRRARSAVVAAGLIALLVGYALLLGIFFAPAILTPDANGKQATWRRIGELGNNSGNG